MCTLQKLSGAVMLQRKNNTKISVEVTWIKIQDSNFRWRKKTNNLFSGLDSAINDPSAILSSPKQGLNNFMNVIYCNIYLRQGGKGCKYYK